MKDTRTDRIVMLALPIVAAMLSQNIMNLIDTFMVGRLGDVALAAVGVGGFFVLACQALTLGLSTGVQAVAARRRGREEAATMAMPLNAAIGLTLTVVPLGSWLLYHGVPGMVGTLNDDAQVVAEAVPYAQTRIVAMAFVAANFAFRGFWAAAELPRLYLLTMLFTHLLNTLLNYLLIFGHWGLPALGVQGAGLASAIACTAGTVVHALLAWRLVRSQGFLRLQPGVRDMYDLLRVAMPYGLQQFLFTAGFVVFFWIVGRMGTAELAAAVVLVNISLLAYLPGIGLGIAAATLVGQALGRQAPAEAVQWARHAARIGVRVLLLVGLPMWLIPEWVLAPFIADEETRALAKPALRIGGIFLFVEGVGLVLMQALYSAGEAKRTMLSAMGLQWLVFLPAVFLAGPTFGWGMAAVWLVQAVYRCAHAALLAEIWRRRWARPLAADSGDA